MLSQPQLKNSVLFVLKIMLGFMQKVYLLVDIKKYVLRVYINGAVIVSLKKIFLNVLNKNALEKLISRIV